MSSADEFETFFQKHLRQALMHGQGSQAYAFCPLHDDKHERSFSVNLANGLWTCHKCNIHGNAVQFARRLGIYQAAVPGLRTRKPKKKVVPVEATFRYLNEVGDLLFEEVRLELGNRKRVFYRRPDGKGGHIKSIAGIRRVLYRLPELQEALERDSPIFVVEGPNKVEALRSLGYAATCNPFGAGHWLPEYSEFLKGLDVVILPDNDSSGQDHARKVAACLLGVAESVKVLKLPGLPYKGDIIDWLKAGNLGESLLKLAWAEPVWRPDADCSEPAKPKTGGGFYVPNWVFTCGIWANMMPSERAVYPVLCRRANNKTRELMTVLEEISAESGVALKSLPSTTDGLAARGLVTKRRRGRRNQYRVSMAPPNGLNSAEPQDRSSKRRPYSFQDAGTGRFVGFDGS